MFGVAGAGEDNTDERPRQDVSDVRARHGRGQRSGALGLVAGRALGARLIRGPLRARLVAPTLTWIAFVLLAGVGGRMIWEAWKRDADAVAEPTVITRKAGIIALVATAIGTSIDAAAVGVGLAFIGVDIWLIALAIGFTTFVMTTIGLGIGRYVGVRFGSAVEIIGGVLLIGIGTAILADHTGFLG